MLKEGAEKLSINSPKQPGFDESTISPIQTQQTQNTTNMKNMTSTYNKIKLIKQG